MQRGVTLLGISLIVAAGAASVARADTGSATTTTTSTTTTTPAPSYAPLATSSLPARCVGAGVALISRPSGAPVAVGTPASSLGASAYRTVLSFDSASAAGSTCKSDAVTLNGVSLFGGAVTATSVEAKDGAGSVNGLAVNGTPATVAPGGSVAVGSWGVLTLGTTSGRLSAPLALRLLRSRASLPAGTTILLAYAATAQPVAKKPAGKTKSTQTPAAKQTAQQSQSTHAAKRAHRSHKKKSHVPQPLKWTPHLGLKASHYVFPIDGGASYVDTYGAGRNDIYDGWHHGDDLFAPLGTPVVAVANGKLSLVGWNSLGGWRIWLTDAKGNSFYYAHLSGYSRWILTHRNVRAGQVIGFLGRTGDAFTTAPHLHFEIHPHQLLKLGYDGAVDPTDYLKSWQVVKVAANEIPQPAKLRAPSGTPTQEASVVWKQLLSARHLMPNGAPVVAFASGVRRPYPAQDVSSVSGEGARRIAAVRTAAHVGTAAAANDGPWPLVVLSLTLLASMFGAFFGVRRRRRPANG